MGPTQAVAALLPVVAFLLLLVYLDSYKLVPLRRVFRYLILGGVLAVLCSYGNRWLLGQSGLSQDVFVRYVAPLVEETAKAIPVWWLIRRARVGFLVDAALCGFAIGTGFAVAENAYYLSLLNRPEIGLWLVRGFGTAIMHAATTAIVAIVTKESSDRRGELQLANLPLGLAAAVIIHSLYNHFVLPAVLMSALNLVTLPLLVLLVFRHSEGATRQWLGQSFDDDAELLDLILAGEVPGTPLGRYLTALKERFPAEVVVDMLCMLRVQLELSIRAKGILLAREAGVEVKVDDEVRDSFRELEHLRQVIGRTGELAIQPFLKTSHRELWQLYALESGF